MQLNNGILYGKFISHQRIFLSHRYAYHLPILRISYPNYMVNRDREKNVHQQLNCVHETLNGVHERRNDSENIK